MQICVPHSGTASTTTVLGEWLGTMRKPGELLQFVAHRVQCGDRRGRPADRVQGKRDQMLDVALAAALQRIRDRRRRELGSDEDEGGAAARVERRLERLTMSVRMRIHGGAPDLLVRLHESRCASLRELPCALSAGTGLESSVR